MATEFIWPSTLPQVPMQDSWGVAPPDLVKATQMEAGPPKRRLKYSKGMETISVGYMFDLDEYKLWRAFLVKIQYGVLSFRWPDPRNNGRRVTVAIQTGSIREDADNNYTKVTFTLEVW